MKLKKDELPKEMQSMTPKERSAHLAKMAQKSADIKQQIIKLTQEREAYVAEKQKEVGQSDPADRFGDAFDAVVAEQLEASGFSIEK
jgi:hypothetical protein